jgi:hypothetical protein
MANWRTGDISHIKENGKYFVKEADSTRPVTAPEKKALEKKVESAQLENKQYQRALKKARTSS